MDDLTAGMTMSACNLFAMGFGARHCAVVSLETKRLEAMSSAFAQLAESLRDETLAAILAAMAATPAGETGAGCLRPVAVAPELGGRGLAMGLAQEPELAVFVVEVAGMAIEPARFSAAAEQALTVIASAIESRVRQRDFNHMFRMLSYVEEVAEIGSWELQVGTNRPTWSDKAYAIHGLEPDGELTMERLFALFPSPASEMLNLEFERSAAEGTSFEVTCPLKPPAGKQRVVRIVGRCRDDVDGRRLYGTVQDVTQQMSAERRLWWAANHDPLTGLPNRLLLEDRLTVAMRMARREARSFALILIEIADIARLTGPAGFATSDKHMLGVATRLSAVLRESDTFARISMTEFALILADIDDENALRPPMQRLRAQFAAMQKQEAGGDGMVMSVGIAFFPEHADGQAELMRAAETALVQARRKLDQSVIIFNSHITDGPTRRRATILMRAREGLKKNEFVPYYQPQFDMNSGEVVGVEALVRWRTPTLTLDAKDFAYVLEDHEIGSQLGHAMLDAVIADIAELRKITDRPFRVSINASRSEVLRNDFLETFLEKAHRGNLKPTDFIIEITEDVIIGIDDQTLHDKISYLVSSGVEFSLDDFGTGYASLIHITSFPIKEIKIDKQFTLGIETDRRKRAIVRGVLQIAQSIGLDVITEGVETLAQQRVLREIGCRYGQGYLFSYPVPFEQFAAMLDKTD